MRLHGVSSRGAERREHQRYVLPAMYSPVWVRELDTERFVMSGHAYDLSRGGMRFELSDPIAPGTRVAVKIGLGEGWGTGSGRDVSLPRAAHAMATVIWVEEDDLEWAGPVRMACAFRNFCGPRDEELLFGLLDSGRYALAA